MRLLFILFLLISGVTGYASTGTNFEEWAISIKEWDSQLPLPIWQLSLGIAIVILILSLRRSSTSITNTSQATSSRQPHSPRRTQTTRPPNPRQTPPVETTNDNEGWKQELVTRSEQVSFPRGGKIIIDGQKDIPFTLRIPHGTPQSSKDAVVRFADFISTIPLPKRIAIRFDEGCKKNEQNMVRGIFRKHFHINDMMIRCEPTRVDIQFRHVDQCWGEWSNINKDFSKTQD